MRLRHATMIVVVCASWLAWPAARATAADYVQITTHTAGINGSLWESDLEIRAEGALSAHVRVDLLGSDRDNTTPLATTTVTVPAGTTMRLVDLIEDTFGLTFTTGALRLTTLSGMPSFSSRTANRGLTSSFGFDIPAEPELDAVSFGVTGRLIHLTGNAALHTNLGFVNTTSMPVAATADLFRADGTFLRTIGLTLAPFDMRRSFNVFDTGDVDDGYVLLSTSTPGGAFLAHAIVVDLVSGDWVWLPASTASGIEATADGFVQTTYIPVVQRAVVGQDLVAWTDLELKAGPNGAAEVRLELLASHQPNPSPMAATVNVPIGEALRIHDVLGSEFGVTGSGALRLTVLSGFLEAADSVSSSGDGGSAWSRFVPAATTAEAFGLTRSAMVLGLERDADHRSDIGLVNLSDLTGQVVVTILDLTGHAVQRQTASLAPWEHRELTAVLAGLSTPAGGSAFVVANRPVLVYGSVTELSTGDAGYAIAVETPLIFADGFESGTTAAW